MFEEILTAISTVGFPIFIVIWYMIVTNKTNHQNIEIITNLKMTIETNTEFLKLLLTKELNNIKED